MLREILKQHIKSQAKYVEYGYGQVEPNHLSAQRTAQIYAQLPADQQLTFWSRDSLLSMTMQLAL